jgi:hypothetical protein
VLICLPAWIWILVQLTSSPSALPRPVPAATVRPTEGLDPMVVATPTAALLLRLVAVLAAALSWRSPTICGVAGLNNVAPFFATTNRIHGGSK